MSVANQLLQRAGPVLPPADPTAFATPACCSCCSCILPPLLMLLAAAAGVVTLALSLPPWRARPAVDSSDQLAADLAMNLLATPAAAAHSDAACHGVLNNGVLNNASEGEGGAVLLYPGAAILQCVPMLQATVEDGILLPLVPLLSCGILRLYPAASPADSASHCGASQQG
jgi:hypothetical protein